METEVLMQARGVRKEFKATGKRGGVYYVNY